MKVISFLLGNILASSMALAAEDISAMYSEVKSNFEKSGWCDPAQVVNDPSKMPSGLLLSRAYRYLDFISSTERYSTNEVKLQRFSAFAKDYSLTPMTSASVTALLEQLPLFNYSKDDQRRLGVAAAKGLILQDLAKQSLAAPTFQVEKIENELVHANIFSEDDDGKLVCPFPAFEAFDKALTGHRNILNATGKTIKKKTQLTIIDFTMPSNHRRLFVIDIEKKMVTMNTWVAHGMGSTNAAGKDGYGSNPDVSNVSGSKKSSPGFVLATQASSGATFGPNVLLRGLESTNRNVASRSIIVHGWSSPFSRYTAGLEETDYETNQSSMVDAYEEFINTDFTQASHRILEKSLYRLSSSLAFSKYLAATEGCPGVPVAKLGHLDSKGRKNTSVLEILRSDLPGSVIFTYTGTGMKSDFFH